MPKKVPETEAEFSAAKMAYQSDDEVVWLGPGEELIVPTIEELEAKAKAKDDAGQRFVETGEGLKVVDAGQRFVETGEGLKVVKE